MIMKPIIDTNFFNYGGVIMLRQKDLGCSNN